jgi:hypothetical protein
MVCLGSFIAIARVGKGLPVADWREGLELVERGEETKTEGVYEKV